jgi:cobalt-zinc-cadmium efflux system outer membrane protein
MPTRERWQRTFLHGRTDARKAATRTATVAFAGVTALAMGARAESPQSFATLSLEQAMARAIERNPLVVESQLEWRRLQGAANGVAGVLAENPSFSSEAGLRRDTALAGKQPSFAASLMQPLDLLGQAGTRRKAADDMVLAARARLALARAEIAARVRLLYLAVQIADKRVELCAERLATARKTEQAVEMRARLGASSDIDLHMASAEASRAQGILEQAHAQVERARLALRDVLDLPATAQARASDPLTPTPPEVPDDLDPQALLAHHLSIQAIEKRRLAIDSDIARLERERLPRLSFGVAAERPSDQESFLGLAFSFSPAFWRRNQGPLAEAHVERERAEYERATTLAGLRRHWTALKEAQRDRRRELQAVEQTLAHEETVRSLVRTGWEAGKFDFLRVLLAERSVADTRQARLDLWSILWTNAIEINRLLGKE